MTDPDLDLARLARSGDRKALAQLYERYRGRLFGYLVRLAGDRQIAEDVFQEVWIKVLQAIDRFEPAAGSFRTWLFRIASNASVDRMRRDAVRSGPALDARVDRTGERRIDGVPSDLPGPERVGEGRAFARDLSRALERLPEAQRTAVLLRHQQGLSYAELAALLHIPEGTAKTTVHRGVKVLREELAEWSDE